MIKNYVTKLVAFFRTCKLFLNYFRSFFSVGDEEELHPHLLLLVQSSKELCEAIKMLILLFG